MGHNTCKSMGRVLCETSNLYIILTISLFSFNLKKACLTDVIYFLFEYKKTLDPLSPERPRRNKSVQL